MNKLFFPLIAGAFLLLFPACSRPISTTEEWVSFCKGKPDPEVIYNEFVSMTPSSCMTICSDLANELATSESYKTETCYAFLYMAYLLYFDMDVHREKYSLEDMAKFNGLQDYSTVMIRAAEQTGGISSEIQTFERLSGSNVLQVN